MINQAINAGQQLREQTTDATMGTPMSTAASSSTSSVTAAPLTTSANPAQSTSSIATTSSAVSPAPMNSSSTGHMSGHSTGMSGMKTKIIKRYQNRKLYDTQQSCYVTLDDIAKMIRTNEDVMVIDNKTKNDITAATLTQIIFEAEKKASQYAPLFTLREIIQNANGSISSYLAKLGAFPKDYANANAKSDAAIGGLTSGEKASYDDLKHSLENRVAKATSEPTELSGGIKFIDDQTPSLPNSNKSLNQ